MATVVVAVVLVLARLVAGAGLLLVGASGGDATATGSGAGGSGRSRPGRTVSSRSEDQLVEDALGEIEAFWADSFSRVYGGDYVPVEGGFYPYGPRTALPPCPGIDSYDDIAENAFYCPEGDFIAGDSKNLLRPLRREFGDLTLGMVMAHEMGHAIQTRAGVHGRAVTLEQQADCFAGAWVRSVAEGRSAVFAGGADELDLAVGGLLLLRDTPGVTADDPDAHGTAFDRVAALGDGFDNGVGQCADYDDDLVASRLVALPFLDEADAGSGGNLPFEEIESVTMDDLDDYWSAVFAAAKLRWQPLSDAVAFDPDDEVPACGGLTAEPDEYVAAAFYCEADDFVAWDEVNLTSVIYEEGGDFAVSTVIGAQYSAAVQARLGLSGDPLALDLQAGCLTGAWAASLFREDRSSSQQLLLSPGDLDEAIMALLAIGDPPSMVGSGDAERGSGFQRIGAFQDGFVNGMEACAGYLTG